MTCCALRLLCVLQVVKTRQQLEGVGTSQSSSLQSAVQPQQQRSALQQQAAVQQQQQRAWPLLLKLCREEGPRGMFRGLSARVAKVAPACAIMISSYEGGKSLFANMQ
jgi:Mitochondrial carrier protein